MDTILWIRRIRLTLAIIACAALLVLAYGGFELVRNSGDLHAVSGSRLRMRLDEFWPPGVDVAKISHASVATHSSIDSGTMFLCFDAEPETVRKWVEFLRQNNFKEAFGLNDFEKYQCETREQQLDSIPFHRASGAIPEWWLPTGGTVSAFETMVWYRDSDSGAGRGKYLQFDERTNRCWIFVYTCQHNLLWLRGDEKGVSEFAEPQTQENH